MFIKLSRKEKRETQKAITINENQMQYNIETSNFDTQLIEHLKKIDNVKDFETAKMAIEKINEGHPSEIYYQIIFDNELDDFICEKQQNRYTNFCNKDFE